MEVEYVELSLSTQAVRWLRGVFNTLGEIQQTTSIMQENFGSKKLATGHPAEDFKKIKHIELRYHYTRERAGSGEIMVRMTSLSDMAASFLIMVSKIEKIREEIDLVRLVDVETLQRTA